MAIAGDHHQQLDQSESRRPEFLHHLIFHLLLASGGNIVRHSRHAIKTYSNNGHARLTAAI
jgi:hypothetical protein